MAYLGHAIQRKRIGIFFGVVFVFFAIITVRLFEFQVLKNDEYLALAQGQHWMTRKIPAKRGLIYTRDLKTGERNILAMNKSLNMVYVVPRQIKDKEEASRELSEILSIDHEEVFDNINNDKVYVPIKHKLSDEEVSKIEECGILGIMLSPEDWRDYPEGELAAQIVGFVNNDGDGQYGVEGNFNDVLKGKEGEVTMERDTAGRPITVGEKQESPASNGKDIVLTVDRVIQDTVERELKTAVEEFSASGGNIIVMNPENGEVWAMANYPTFDPNRFNEIKDIELFKNSSISHVYEPGSIFKIITMAAGIDASKVMPNTTYFDTGEVKIGGYSIRNSDGKAHGTKTMTQVLEDSLNTGSFFVKEQMGNEIFYNYLKKFGFGQTTGIGLSGEIDSPIKVFDSWREINFATASFGQGIAVTPIQFITAASAIANGGKIVEPHIVSEFVMPDGSKTSVQKKIKDTAIREETSNMVGAMMVNVVEKGHGKAARVPGFRVAGKTGTAEIPSKDGTGYEEEKNIGSFVLFVPAENAKFIILVKIDEPKGVEWAESTAAPVAGSLAKKILNYLEIPPNIED